MAMKTPETDQQKKFFTLLVEGSIPREGEPKRTPGQAALEAGYAHEEMAYDLIRHYREYYLDRLYNRFLLYAPKAMQVILDGMDYDGKSIGQKEKTLAAQDVLDRAGFVKKDKIEISTDGAAGVFILPAKEREEKLDDTESPT